MNFIKSPKSGPAKTGPVGPAPTPMLDIQQSQSLLQNTELQEKNLWKMKLWQVKSKNTTH